MTIYALNCLSRMDFWSIKLLNTIHFTKTLYFQCFQRFTNYTNLLFCLISALYEGYSADIYPSLCKQSLPLSHSDNHRVLRALEGAPLPSGFVSTALSPYFYRGRGVGRKRAALSPLAYSDISPLTFQSITNTGA